MADDNVERILFLEKLFEYNEQLEEGEDTPDAIPTFGEDNKEKAAIGERHAAALEAETEGIERNFRRAIAKTHGAQETTPRKSEASTEDNLHKRAELDGEVTEKLGTQTWTYFYVRGELMKSHVRDPELPGGQMCFDHEGNEVAA